MSSRARWREEPDEEALTSTALPWLLTLVTLAFCLVTLRTAGPVHMSGFLWVAPAGVYVLAEMLAPRLSGFGRFPLSAAAFSCFLAIPQAGPAWLGLAGAGVVIRWFRGRQADEPAAAQLADLLPEIWSGLAATVAARLSAPATATAMAAVVYLSCWQVLPGLFVHALSAPLTSAWTLARERSLALTTFLVILGGAAGVVSPQAPAVAALLLVSALLLCIPVQAQLKVLQSETQERVQALREQAQARTSVQLAELRSQVELQKLEVELQHRVLTLVGELFMETALVQSPDEMRPSLLNFVRRVVPCTRASLYEQQGTELHLSFAAGAQHLKLRPEQLAALAADRVRATVLEDDSGGAHMGAVIPERGLLVLSADEPRWQLEHAHLLQRVASHLPLCLDALRYRELQSRALEDEQMRRRELDRLAAKLTAALDVLTDLVGCHTLTELVERCLVRVPELVRGYLGEIRWRGQVFVPADGLPLTWTPRYSLPLRTTGSESGELRLFSAVAAPLEAVDLELLRLFSSTLASLLQGAHLNSELSQALEQVKQSQAQLVQSSKMAAIGQLAAGVAHELNTPLGAISIAVELAVENVQSHPDRALKRLHKALESVGQMQGIISKLLFYSRDSRGVLHVVDLNKVMEDSYQLVAHTLKINGTDFELRPGPETLLETNANELQQVFSNLLINAKDACNMTGAQRKRIEMWLTRDDHEAQIFVRDYGCGMDEATRQRIFEPFFTTKPIGQGTGLGLSTSLQLIQQHGGKLTCDSAPGQGTTFRVTLPLEKA